MKLMGRHQQHKSHLAAHHDDDETVVYRLVAFRFHTFTIYSHEQIICMCVCVCMLRQK